MIAVVGLGNVLMEDDSWGPVVVRCFDAWYEVGADVEIEDLGTPGFDLLPHLMGRDHLLVVDTVRGMGAPGSLRFFSREELLASGPGPRTSPHDPGLKEALLSLDVHESRPEEFALLGVVPRRTRQGTDLSPEVATTVAAACELIAERLRQWGCEVRRRQPSRSPDLWWVEETRFTESGVG